jgi:hypothetical protein
MTDQSDNITLHHLQAIRAELAPLTSEVRTGFKDNTAKIGLLADGLLSLRRNVENLNHNVQTLIIAGASHGERLADIEARLNTEPPPQG